MNRWDHLIIHKYIYCTSLWRRFWGGLDEGSSRMPQWELDNPLGWRDRAASSLDFHSWKTFAVRLRCNCSKLRHFSWKKSLRTGGPGTVSCQFPILKRKSWWKLGRWFSRILCLSCLMLGVFLWSFAPHTLRPPMDPAYGTPGTPHSEASCGHGILR